MGSGGGVHGDCVRVCVCGAAHPLPRSCKCRSALCDDLTSEVRCCIVSLDHEQSWILWVSDRGVGWGAEAEGEEAEAAV